MFRSSLGMSRPACALALLGAALVLGLGCSGGKKGGKASGTVSYNNAPVTGGKLMLRPASGEVITIDIDGSGAFSKKDVPPGTYAVSVSTDNVPEAPPVPTPGEVPAEYKDKPLPKPDLPNAPPGVTMQKRVHIPAKYKDPSKSGLTWEIGKGDNKKDFTLTDD